MKKRTIKCAKYITSYYIDDYDIYHALDNAATWRLKRTIDFDKTCDIPGGWYVFPLIVISQYYPDLYLTIISKYDNLDNYVAGIFDTDLELFEIVDE